MSEHHGSTKLTHKINHYSKHSHGKQISSTLRSLATNLFPRTPYHQFSNLFPSTTLSIQASYTEKITQSSIDIHTHKKRKWKKKNIYI